MVGYIYEIRNLVNNKIYIGSTINYKNRKRGHFNDLRNGKHSSSYLQNSYNKHGEEKFEFNIIEKVEINDRSELYKYENDYCVKWKTSDPNFGYNMVLPTINGGPDDPKNSVPIYKINSNGIIVGEYRSVGECARDMNCGETMIFKVLNGEKDNKSGFRFIRKSDYNENIDYSFKHKNRKSDRIGKKINQYTLDGKFIKTFNKVKDAAKELNMRETPIVMSCKLKQKSGGGFIWKYYNGENNLTKEELKSYEPLKSYPPSKVIYQYDLEMNFIKKYESIRDIPKEFNRAGIRKCICGYRRKYLNFIWTRNLI